MRVHFSFLINTAAKGALQVTYTYEIPGTPVPEPATMILFGTGLMGLAWCERRKNHTESV